MQTPPKKLFLIFLGVVGFLIFVPTVLMSIKVYANYRSSRSALEQRLEQLKTKIADDYDQIIQLDLGIPDTKSNLDAAELLNPIVNWSHYADRKEFKGKWAVQSLETADWLNASGKSSFKNVDTTWMKELSKYSKWSLDSESAGFPSELKKLVDAEPFRVSPVYLSYGPNLVHLLDLAKVRWAQAVVADQFETAKTELRFLAKLLMQQPHQISAMVGYAILRYESEVSERFPNKIKKPLKLLGRNDFKTLFDALFAKLRLSESSADFVSMVQSYNRFPMICAVAYEAAQLVALRDPTVYQSMAEVLPDTCPIEHLKEYTEWLKANPRQEMDFSHLLDHPMLKNLHVRFAPIPNRLLYYYMFAQMPKI